MITVDAVAPPAEIVNVSGPSVRASFKRVTLMVAVPLELTTALPFSAPPATSAALMPERVYETEVPEATLVVLRVKEAVEPSLTEVVFEDSE